MADTKIEWTDATWNPIVGCAVVSPGCTNCYAMKQAARLLDKPGSHYEGTTEKVNGKAVWTGKVALAPEHILTAPLHWKKPSRVFVNSMGDLFHEDVPSEWVEPVFDVMLQTDHSYQILTKRPDRMQVFIHRFLYPALTTKIIENIWLGTSVEDQKRKERIEYLRQTPAEVRFLSLEPLIEDLGKLDLTDIHWVIVGGESGTGARPCDMDWIRAIIDQCKAAEVPVFVKQLGARPIEGQLRESDEVTPWRVKGKDGRPIRDRKGGDMDEWEDRKLRVREWPRFAM